MNYIDSFKIITYYYAMIKICIGGHPWEKSCNLIVLISVLAPWVNRVPWTARPTKGCPPLTPMMKSQRSRRSTT